MENIAIDTCSLHQVLDIREPDLCPYHDRSANVCRASLSSIRIDGNRCAGYCSCDNFDNCALFLAKTLRRR